MKVRLGLGKAGLRLKIDAEGAAHLSPLQGRAGRAAAQQRHVFLQRQAALGDEHGVGYAHIAKVPGLVGDARHRLLVRRIAQDEAKFRRAPPEGGADAAVREIRADEVDVGRGQAQVDGQARFVLAAAGPGHIFLGKRRALFFQRVVPDGLLFLPTAPAGHRNDLPLAAHGADAGVEQSRRPTIQQDVRMLRIHRHQVGPAGDADGVDSVDQHQSVGKTQFFTHRCRHPSVTSVRIMRVISSEKPMPMPRIMLG